MFLKSCTSIWAWKNKNKNKKKRIQTHTAYRELRIKYNMLGKKNPNFLYKYI